MSLDYIVPGIPAHDDLLLDALTAQKGIVQWWRENREVPPFMILWPRESMLDGGNVISGKFALNLPRDPVVWKDLARKAAERIGAYAILLTYQYDAGVLSILESRDGTLSWNYRIADHGPDKILEEPTFKKDEHYVGLFWEPSSPADPPAP